MPENTFLTNAQELESSKLPCRIVVVSRVYHQQLGKQPVSIGCQFSKKLETDEQPYQRRIRLSEGWRALDLGWLESCGYLCLQNEKVEYNHVLSNQEKTLESARIIDLGVQNPDNSIIPCFCLAPGESLQGIPHETTKYFVRCRQGFATLIIFASPR